MTEYGLDDIGNILVLTVLEDDVAKDLSAATVKEYFIKKPNEIVSKVTAAFNTDGIDGKLTYTFIAGDLDIIGQYEVQIAITSPTWTGKSSSYHFLVRDTLVVTI